MYKNKKAPIALQMMLIFVFLIMLTSTVFAANEDLDELLVLSKKVSGEPDSDIYTITLEAYTKLPMYEDKSI